MQTIEIKSGLQIGIEEIFNGIQQLDNQALTSFAGEVNRLLSSRSAKSANELQSELLKKIKAVIPATVKRRQAQLYAQMEQGAIAPKEREELLLLNHLLEEKSAERILLMGKLAELKGISIGELVGQLKMRAANA